MISKQRTLQVAIILVAVVALQQAPPAKAYGEPGLLVSAEWLNARLQDGHGNLVVLHVGRDGTYEEAHIPGAVKMDRAGYSDPDSHSEGSLILELPDPSVFESVLRERGVDEDSHIVVYWSGHWVTAASRLIFTLDWAGLGDRAALLDGGLDAWTAAGFETSKSTSETATGNVTVRPRNIVVDAEWVQANLETERLQFVDARAAAFFDGVKEDRGVRGHIPGAGSIPWTSLLDEETMKLHPREKLSELLAAAGVAEGDTVVGYCHIGLFTTLALFTARLLDHEVLLYDGAFQDWAERRLPVDAGP